MTSDDDTAAAASIVEVWLKDPTAKSPRCLHAVVNNAGIGIGGLVDWTDVSVYQKVMDGKSYFLHCNSG